jgi:xanthine dehydrogenase accessory factor
VGQVENIFTQISELLKEGRAVALARIIQHAGSSPRATGTGCFILDDGAIRGTIGGGRLEYEVAGKAKDNFTAGRSLLLHFELTGTEVASAEKMICGGVVDVYVEYLSPANRETVAVFDRISELSRAGKRGILFTLVKEGISSGNTACRAFLAEDGSQCGAVDGFSLNEKEKRQWLEAGRTAALKPERDGFRLFVEPVEPDEVLYLFGAGHISTCMAPLVKILGFHLTVADDRVEFCNRERFPQADELLVAPFTEVFERINISSSSYLVIVTRGHLHDLTVLRAALRCAPAYIGMIGSSRKIKMIYQALLEEGFSQESLQKVHAPIGLKIGAESPEEIAVCIAAELIQVRAGLRKSS